MYNRGDNLTKDLRWFFNESQRELGFKSSFSAFIKQMWAPNHTAYCESFYTDSLLARIARHRRIYKAVSKLSKEQYRQLLAIYQEDYQSKYPRPIVHEMAEHTGLALTLHSNLKQLEQWCTQVRHSTISNKDRIEFQNFKDYIGLEFRKLHDLIQLLIEKEEG